MKPKAPKVGADDLVAAGATKADFENLPREEITMDTKMSAAAVLARLAEAAAVFHTPAGKGFVAIPVNGHVETLPVRSKAFKGCYFCNYLREAREAAAHAGHDGDGGPGGSSSAGWSRAGGPRPGGGP